MNYRGIYDRIISGAVGRQLSCYKELHHVLPRCMGGGNEDSNLVYLTAKEHFVAHQLLVKIYPEVKGLAFALLRMAAHCNNGRIYSWMRIRAADALKGNKWNIGRKQTPYMRAVLRAVQVGRKNSPETIAKMSLAAMGNKRALGKKLPPRTPEHCAAISASKKAKGLHLSEETKRKISLALRGKPRPRRNLISYSQEQRERNVEFCKRLAR